jgi:hypothetical protein
MMGGDVAGAFMRGVRRRIAKIWKAVGLALAAATLAGASPACAGPPEVIRDGSPVSLWEPLGEDYLAGDGEDFSLPLRFEFTAGDVLRLKATNTASSYDYHHNMTINIDYEDSLAGRVVAAIGGVI